MGSRLPKFYNYFQTSGSRNLLAVAAILQKVWTEKLEQMDDKRLVKRVYEEVLGRDQEGDQEIDDMKI